jgi:hypothetical protein
MKPDDIDILAIHLAGARLQPEKSKALPQSYYGDPAKHVQFQSEKNCGNCVYSVQGKKGVFCSKGNQYGIRCNSYKQHKKGNK